MKRLVAIALTLILCLSLCFFAAAEETDVYGKYEEPIKLTILSEDFKTGNTNYDANDPRRASATQNVWIDAYKDYLNIDVDARSLKTKPRWQHSSIPPWPPVTCPTSSSVTKPCSTRW